MKKKERLGRKRVSFFSKLWEFYRTALFSQTWQNFLIIFVVSRVESLVRERLLLSLIFFNFTFFFFFFHFFFFFFFFFVFLFSFPIPLRSSYVVHFYARTYVHIHICRMCKDIRSNVRAEELIVNKSRRLTETSVFQSLLLTHCSVYNGCVFYVRRYTRG